jgi:hypothetical protein
MMDLSPVPADMGNNGVCVGCHQGRESGWTTWNQIRYFRRTWAGDSEQAASDFRFTNKDDQIDPTGTGRWATVNAHDLAAAGFVWGRNADEMPAESGTLLDGTTPVNLTGKFDDGIPKHRQKGCVGCHMSNTDMSNPADPLGGHTWNVNIVTCRECHPGLSRFQDVNAKTDYDGSNGATVTVGQKVGTYAALTAHTNGTPGNTTTHVDVWTNPAVGGTGLIGLINRGLYDGIPVRVTVLPLKNGGTQTFNPPHVVRIHLEMSSSASLKAWAGEDLTYAANNPGQHYYYNQYVGTTNAGTLSLIVTPRLQNIYFNLYQLTSASGSFGANGFANQAYVHDAIFVAQELIDVLNALGRTTNPFTNQPFVRPVSADGGSTHDARDYRNATTNGGPNL